MSEEIAPVLGFLVAASPSGGRFLAPITIYNVLTGIALSFHKLDMSNPEVVKSWSDRAKSLVVHAIDGRPDSVQQAVPKALAMVLGVDHILFPHSPSLRAETDPRESRDKALDRVLRCAIERKIDRKAIDRQKETRAGLSAGGVVCEVCIGLEP